MKNHLAPLHVGHGIRAGALTIFPVWIDGPTTPTCPGRRRGFACASSRPGQSLKRCRRRTCPSVPPSGSPAICSQAAGKTECWRPRSSSRLVRRERSKPCVSSSAAGAAPASISAPAAGPPRRSWSGARTVRAARVRSGAGSRSSSAPRCHRDVVAAGSPGSGRPDDPRPDAASAGGSARTDFRRRRPRDGRRTVRKLARSRKAMGWHPGRSRPRRPACAARGDSV